MLTAVRASSSNSATSGTAISVSAPTGTTTGDLVVCIVHANGQTTLVDNNSTIATPVNLTSGSKTADATSATTASITTVSGRLYLLSVTSKTEITANPNQPTATGTGLAFITPSGGTVVNDDSSSSRRRITYFYAIATVSGSTTVVVDFASQTQVTSVWSIEEIAYGFNTTTPIVQAANNSSPTVAVTSITATLGAFGASSNITFGCGAIGNGTNTITVGTGFTQLSQTKDTVENNLNLITQYKLSNDTTVDISFVSQSECGIIGVEIQASTATFTEDLNDYQPNPTYGHTVSVFSRRILAGDPATYNFTSGGTGRWSIVAVTISDPNPDTIFDAALVSSNSSDATADPFTVTGITTATDNAIHIVMGALDDGVVTVANNPAGYTTIQNTANQPMGVSYKVITPAGATGGKDVDFSGAGACIGVSLAIRSNLASIALTGTATASITEADIVTGGKTIILTLTNDTWVAVGATFNAQRQNIINGIDSAQAEGTGWDAVVKALQGVAGVVRTSNTVVTITLDPQASYNITSTETITTTIPSTALTGAVAIVASPTFAITATSASNAPVVVNGVASLITKNSVIVTGEVTDIGGSAIIERGFVLSTSPTPTINGTKYVVGGGLGQFSLQITKLKAGKTYYIRVFASNSLGVSYG